MAVIKKLDNSIGLKINKLDKMKNKFSVKVINIPFFKSENKTKEKQK